VLVSLDKAFFTPMCAAFTATFLLYMFILEKKLDDDSLNWLSYKYINRVFQVVGPILVLVWVPVPLMHCGSYHRYIAIF
jgi:hypothetical protein